MATSMIAYCVTLQVKAAKLRRKTIDIVRGGGDAPARLSFLQRGEFVTRGSPVQSPTQNKRRKSKVPPEEIETPEKVMKEAEEERKDAEDEMKDVEDETAEKEKRKAEKGRKEAENFFIPILKHLEP